MLDIRAEVANALNWDIALPRHRVTAKVDGGWVTLQGVVELGVPEVPRRGGRAQSARGDRHQERNCGSWGGLRSFNKEAHDARRSRRSSTGSDENLGARRRCNRKRIPRSV